MRHQSGPNLIKIFVVLFCLVCIGASFAGIKYLEMQTSELIKENTVYQEQIKKAEDDIEKLDSLMAQYHDDMESFEKILFREKDIPLFLERMADSFEEYTVSLKNMEALKVAPVRVPDEDEAKKKKIKDQKEQNQQEEEALKIVSSPFRINIEGQMTDILKFIFSLEESRQLLTITDVKFGIQKYPIIQASFKLDLYSLSGDLVFKEEK